MPIFTKQSLTIEFANNQYNLDCVINEQNGINEKVGQNFSLITCKSGSREGKILKCDMKKRKKGGKNSKINM